MRPSCGPFSFKQRAVLGLLPPFLAFAMSSLVRSWRVRSSIHPDSDPRGTKPLIFALWHETVITIIGHWRGANIQGLASQSFDGELIAAIMIHLGYPPVSRGSSSRGGASALMSHAQALQEGRHVAITMDGPRGPASTRSRASSTWPGSRGSASCPRPAWPARTGVCAAGTAPRCLRPLPRWPLPWASPWTARPWPGRRVWGASRPPWLRSGTGQPCFGTRPRSGQTALDEWKHFLNFWDAFKQWRNFIS